MPADRVTGPHDSTLRLPATYLLDWERRCANQSNDPQAPHAEIVKVHGPAGQPREVTVRLNEAALADLIQDAQHYTDPAMLAEYWESARGVVLSARATLRRLTNLGIVKGWRG